MTAPAPNFTLQELMFLADVCNPGLMGAHVGHSDCSWAQEEHEATYSSDSWLAMEMRTNAEDSFGLYPGSYEKKWGIDRTALTRKLREASDSDLAQVARAVARFWDHCHDPDCENKLVNLEC